MALDQEICLCFHVSLRKVIQFIRHEKPVYPSQISECQGAGTGCGWCRPYLKQVFDQVKGEEGIPSGTMKDSHPSFTSKLHDNVPENDLSDREKLDEVRFENLTPDQYAQQRSEHIRQGRGKPP